MAPGVLRRSAWAIVVAAACGCSTDPHSIKISEANREKPYESVKDVKGLTGDEARLLLAYQIRMGASELTGSTKPNVVGRTVGDLIEEQRKFETDAQTRAAEQERLAKEAKAKQDALAAELTKSLSLAVFEKTEHSSDYEQYILIKCAYENKSLKDIRAFKGVLHFTDLFGAAIYTTTIRIDDPIKAGEKAEWIGSVKYNQFIDEMRRFKGMDLKDMKIQWVPTAIIFSDGTQIGATE
jgi:hypothetical protein